MSINIEYKKVTHQWLTKLTRFFEEIITQNEDVFFHPHPLNYEAAKEIASLQGQDLYFLQIKDNDITGYGMLRGWDDGYLIPSLGIAIHPRFRRQGLAKKFMDFMHQKAKEKGAQKIRLTVYTSNIAAIRLYRSYGYAFSEEKDHKLIGYCEL